MDDIETFSTLLSALIAAVALAASWFAWRSSELRRDHVHSWGNEVIQQLQLVELVCILPDQVMSPAKKYETMEEAALRTSILIEQGRLFFKNKVIDEFGSDKSAAYRGYRPKLLDEIVVAHQIACEWPRMAEAELVDEIGKVASASKREFVSLLQKEVGRQRTVSADTSKHGDGGSLSFRLRQLER